jgi:dynactin 1
MDVDAYSRLDHMNAIIREQLKRIETDEETIADYEHTISQFRELVQNLQMDIERLKDMQMDQNGPDSDRLKSQSQAMISLNLQLQTTVMKAQAKQIDLELRKLEVTQATQHLSYIEASKPSYFPPTFTHVH